MSPRTQRLSSFRYSLGSSDGWLVPLWALRVARATLLFVLGIVTGGLLPPYKASYLLRRYVIAGLAERRAVSELELTDGAAPSLELGDGGWSWSVSFYSGSASRFLTDTRLHALEALSPHALAFVGCSLSREDLARCGRIASLRRLSLIRCTVEDAHALEPLRTSASLEQLYCRGTTISAHTLLPALDAPRLRYVDLRETPIQRRDPALAARAHRVYIRWK